MKMTDPLLSKRTAIMQGAIDDRLPDQDSYSPKKARYRVINSCLPCHRQKRRCDRKRPCSHCLKRHNTGQCAYEAVLEAEAGDSATGNIETDQNPEMLRRRVAELEAVVADYKARERNYATPGPRGRIGSNASSTEIEHDADGVYYGRGFYLGNAAAPDFLKRILSLTPDDQKDLVYAFLGSYDSGAAGCGGNYIFPTLFPVTCSVLDMLQTLQTLGREAADRLLEAYFEIVDPLHHYVPTPWLLQRYDRCWLPDHSGENVAAQELALVFAVLGLGDLVSSNSQAWFFICTSVQLLRTSNFLANPSLDCIHTFSYIAVYLQHEGKLGEYWPLLGLVIRLCQSMALHRDPAIILNLSKEEAELRRRAFWTVAAQETAISTMFGRPNGIGSSDCKLPADLSDDELFGEPPSTADWSINEISYNLMTWDLGSLTREMLQTSNDGKVEDFEKLASIESRIETWLATRPKPFLRTANKLTTDTMTTRADRRSYVQSICLHMIAKHDVLILYRKAAMSGDMPRARRPCLEAALSICECWQELQDHFPKMARITWMHWYRAFHAALICFVVISDGSCQSVDYTRATAAWMSCLRIFTRIKNQNQGVMSCWRALDRLNSVLKQEGHGQTPLRRYSWKKQVGDTSAQLLVPKVHSLNRNTGRSPNFDGHPNPSALQEDTARETAFGNSRDLLFTNTFDFGQIAPSSASNGTVSASSADSGMPQEVFGSTTNSNIFDLDIQNWPAWLTNSNSPQYDSQTAQS